jgi:DNA gyrase subunit A
MPSQGDLFERSFAREVIETPVTDEMSESFLAYSLSVITSRAIPDVRDGLKPVQRRILYSMAQLGHRPDRPHRKCAGVVGDTMGKYHPHGDSAIYDALTRMGQEFSRNIRLVDPHGNFGSLDDPPAAYRYTECRLSPAAIELLAEIDEDTVEFRPTFDGERSEPIYLPARLPNLLVNGTSGIAVGMATNMAPHNLTEVYEAIKLVMTKRRPKPTIDELMAVLPGPDLPSGGIIIDDGLADAYATGRGTFRMRATAEIVNLTRSRQGIVVTQLPYMVGPERVVARIQELVNNGKLAGVANVKNLQDRRTGMNITIELKGGVNAKAVLTELYRLTPLEETFGVNNVVLVDGNPTTVGPVRPVPPLHRAPPRRGPPPHRSTGSAGHATAAPGRGSAHRARRDRPGRVDHPLVPGRRGGQGGDSSTSCR